MKKGLAFVGKLVLAVGMFLYLGKHSLNFFSFTFRGEDVLYSYLGLLTTSGGVLVWLLIFMDAESAIEVTTAFVMLGVSLLGEFLVAGFDMYMNAVGGLEGKQFKPEELRSMIIVVAALALLHGLALVVHQIGEKVVRVWNEKRSVAVDPAKDAAAPRVVASHPLVISSPKPVVNQDSGGGFTD